MGILNRKNKKKEFTAIADRKKKSPFETGKGGTIEELRAENQKAEKMRLRGDAADLRLNLISGAAEALCEGRPENIQTLLAERDTFKLKYTQIRNAFYRLAEEKEGGSTVNKIDLALEKVPAQEKQDILNQTLCAVVDYAYEDKDEALIAALLKAGADANAEFDGQPGRILATAISNSFPTAIIKLMYDSGAPFEDALFRISTRPYWDAENRRESAITKLKAYREVICGAAAAEADDKTQKMIRELQEQVADLTTEVRALREGRPAAAATQKKPGPGGYKHLSME
jgi:hypothetical protein